jgi:hypothetical protein
VIVYEVIGIVKKKLRKTKSERVSERSDAEEMLGGSKADLEVWLGAELGRKAGIWGAGERGGV